jgi:hypothetical protein
MMTRFVSLFVVLFASTAAGTSAAEPMPGHAMAAKADHPTCGQMISGMASIPEKLSQGANSVAEMLEAHAALMGKDKASVAEAKGLRAIAKTHRQIATEMLKASQQMKQAASWPAAPHDMAKMGADPKLAAANQKVIEVHKGIIAAFQQMVADMESHAKAAK